MHDLCMTITFATMLLLIIKMRLHKLITNQALLKKLNSTNDNKKTILLYFIHWLLLLIFILFIISIFILSQPGWQYR